MNLLEKTLTVISKANKSFTDPAGGILELIERGKERKINELRKLLKEEGKRKSEDYSKYSSDVRPEDIAMIFEKFLGDEELEKAKFYALLFKGMLRGQIIGQLKVQTLKLVSSLSVIQLKGIVEIYSKLPYCNPVEIAEISENRKYCSTLARNKNPITKGLIQSLIHFGYFDPKDGTKPPMPSADFFVLGNVFSEKNREGK